MNQILLKNQKEDMMQWIQHMLHFIQEIKEVFIIDGEADRPIALHIEADHQDTADQKEGINPLT